MNEEKMKALFLLAGFNIISTYQLVNQYWPANEHYAEVIRKSPWWLVNTEFGLITIGWRKRVIEIEWKDIKNEISVTDDEVTKSKYLVHAWGYVKAVEYLTTLHQQLTETVTKQSTDGDPEAVAEAQAICAFESVNTDTVWSYLKEEDKNYWRTISQAVLHGTPINRLGN